MTDQRGALNPTESTSIESGANSAQTRSVDAPEKVADIDADIIERLVALNRAEQEQAKVLREELATLEGKIRQRENAIEALQGRGALSKRGKVVGQGKDPIKSARAAWNQSKRKDRPMSKAEQDRREQAYRALLKGKK